MQALDRKLLRDLWRLRGQVLAIALVVGAGVATLVLSLGTRESLIATQDAYYERNRFAHVFAHLKRAPEHLRRRIEAIAGVARADTRIVDWVLLDMPDVVEPVRGEIVSLPKRAEQGLNTVFLRMGRAPQARNPDEAIVHEAFAEAHGLKPGDRVTATINGKQRRLDVVGIGLSPEFVYSIGVGDLVPDNRRHGVLWMGREALEAAYDLTGAFNDVSLLLRHDAVEAEVITQLDDLLARYGGSGAYSRDDQLSHAFVKGEIEQLTALTGIVPPIFIAVAIFLLNVVTSRLIQTEREQIGLLKAFGYTDVAIGLHYLKFSLAIAVLGTIVGSLAGAWLGRGMTEMYAAYYRFPLFYYRPDPRVFVIAAFTSLAAGVAGAALGVRWAVRLMPAVAMSPPPPALYRRGLSDWLGLVRTMTPTGRMVVRHIARRPLRSALTAGGMALSLGLLVSTLYFFDAIDAMVQSFFEGSQSQDVTVRFAEPREESAAYELARLPGVLRAELRRVVPVRLISGVRRERVAIFGFDPEAEMSRLVDRAGRRIELPPEGLVLSERLAANLDARPGDLITVEVLEGRRDVADVAVSAVVSEHIGTFAYMDRRALNRLLREPASGDAANLLVDSRQEPALFRALLERPTAFSISVRRAAFATFREMIDEMIVQMITFYVMFAAIIAAGVIYNSGRITLSERARELASLRVLGYHRREVAAILAGELAILTLLSLPIGCAIGYGLAFYFSFWFSTDLYRLPLTIEPATYGYAVIIVLIAAGLTALATVVRVARLDLIAVLKTRD
jgi:putative ABC transport system permease protein